MKKKLLLMVLGIGVIITAVVAHWAMLPPHSQPHVTVKNKPVPETAELPDASLYERLGPLHRVKTAPSSTDWLAMHPEAGQTFADYIEENPARPDAEKAFLSLVLLGDFDETQQMIIRQTAQFLEAYFGMKTALLSPIPLSVIPPGAQRIHPVTGDHQLLTSYIIEEVLKPLKPRGAFCLLAFTASDLWPGEGWNFVFGQASMEDRLGIWSLYRNGDPRQGPESYRLCLRRTLKTGTHELGHLFSLQHCIFYECNMNGSNHRQESDRRPLWLCPVCLRKLFWATGQDPVQRFERLSVLAESWGLDEEASFYRRTLRLLQVGLNSK